MSRPWRRWCALHLPTAVSHCRWRLGSHVLLYVRAHDALMLKMLKTNMYQDSHTQRYSRQMWMSCWVLCFCSNSDTLGHPDRVDEGDIHTVTTYSHLSTSFTYFTFFRCLICINILNIPEETRISNFYKVSVGDFCGIRDQPDQPWTFHICRWSTTVA